ncbi:uncharacterized protein At1g10890-like [Etheostoma cragini]|uniref:uncharacterized protein At1g10890-like n=1 Tax=Etheostoma cragini TaxID=417921 RepID=UPI00155EC7A7|nr:uncharacterized protein At1g10890-like [Etheostoma cragini]
MLTVGKTTNVTLESHLEMERAQAQELKDKLSKMEEALREQEEEAKDILERSQASHRAQLEMQNQSNKNIIAALEKKCEHQLESKRVLWHREEASLLEESEKTRASHVAQIDEQSFASDCLLASLKKTEQQLKSKLNQWKEDKASLLQATESLKLTQQEKEQEWEMTESTLRSTLKPDHAKAKEEEVEQKASAWLRKRTHLYWYSICLWVCRVCG